MSKKDPNYAVKVEQAIAKKYGATYEFLKERTLGDADFSYANILKAEILLDYKAKYNDIVHWV